jgi:GT2 family glycosyltransferase
MRISVIVATYNAPRELDLALHGIARQSTLPNEIVIADDGSREDTRDRIESWRARFPMPLHHVWQEDLGFRKSRVQNEAVRRASGDYLVFLDGDSIPHRHWIADHVSASRERRVLCGRRVRLGPKLSARLTGEDVDLGRLEKPLGIVFKSAVAKDSKRALLGVRLPPLVARLFHPRSRKLMGVNVSMPRRAFESVNGFDEAFEHYGWEDLDLEIRLRRSGFELYPLLNRAVVYHMYHPMKAFTKESAALVKKVQASTRTRCDVGLEQHAHAKNGG